MKTPLKFLCLALPALLLAACGGGGDDNADDRLDLADPKIRLVHALPLAPDISLFRQAQSVAPELTGLSYKDASPYVEIGTDTFRWDVKTETTPAVPIGNVTFDAGRGNKYTVIAVPDAGSATEVVLIDDPYNKGIVSDNARVRMFNASFNATAVDTYLTAPGTDLATVQPVFSTVNYKQAVPASGQDSIEVEGGTYQLRLTTAGTKTVIFNATVNLAENADWLLATVPASVNANDLKVLVVQADSPAPAIELSHNP
jgi:hypothetical protein